MIYNGTERPDFTPDNITSLESDEVFVFGSNLEGLHGGGAAYVAFRKFGAEMGCGTGLRGQSYAIPTMQGGVDTIRPYVDEFISFAGRHPELFFYVTRIGCGIAGFRDRDIAPLFEGAAQFGNICLPESFVRGGRLRKKSAEEQLLSAFAAEENIIEACHRLLREGLGVSYKPGPPNGWPLGEFVPREFLAEHRQLCEKVPAFGFLGRSDVPGRDFSLYCLETTERLGGQETEDITLALKGKHDIPAAVFIRSGQHLAISVHGLSSTSGIRVFHLSCDRPDPGCLETVKNLFK